MTEEPKKMKLSELELVKPTPSETTELADGLYSVKLEKPLEELEVVEVESKDGELYIYYTTVPLVVENKGKINLRVKVGTRRKDETEVKESLNFNELRNLSTEKFMQIGVDTVKDGKFIYKKYTVYG